MQITLLPTSTKNKTNYPFFSMNTHNDKKNVQKLNFMNNLSELSTGKTVTFNTCQYMQIMFRDWWPHAACIFIYLPTYMHKICALYTRDQITDHLSSDYF